MLRFLKTVSASSQTSTQWSAYKKYRQMGLANQNNTGPSQKNNTTLSQTIQTAPTQKTLHKMHRKVWIQTI